MTTFGQMMLADILPPDLYQPGMPINKKQLSSIMSVIAKRSPEEYPKIVKQLLRLGLKGGQSMGGASFGLKDLQPSKDIELLQHDIQQRVRGILQSEPDPKLRRAKINKLLRAELGTMNKTVYDDSVRTKNRFALQLEGAGRGNKSSLMALRGGDILATDSSGNDIPFPVNRGFTQGLTPGQYHATAYGARKNIAQTKLCLAVGTRVRMADGNCKAIEDIQVGDIVLGAGVDGRVRPVKVLQVFDNGLRKCNRYSFRRFSSRTEWFDLVATPDHKILASLRPRDYEDINGYLPAMRPLRDGKVSQQNTGGFVAIPAMGYEEGALFGHVSEPRALLAGLIISDGCIVESTNAISLSCADPSLIAETRSYLAGFGLYLSGDYQKSYTHVLAIDTKDRQTALFKQATTRSDLGHRTRQKGPIDPTCRWLEEVIGRGYAHQKHLPAGYWDWDRESTTALLAGLLSGDSCLVVKNNRLQAVLISFASKQLVEQIAKLLEVKFGIWGGAIRRMHTEGVNGRKRDLWGYYIANRVALSSLFRHIVPKFVGVKRLDWPAYSPVVKYHPHSGRQLAANKFGFRLSRIEAAGRQHTYDIEVDHPNHAFVLENGLIVSNSVGDSGYLSKLIQQAAHRLAIVDDDDPEPIGQRRGYLVDSDDTDNVGALLAEDTGPYPRNTPITPSMLSRLKKTADKILVRSPITSSSLDGGVYSRDVGIREFGRLARRGEHVGLPAAQAIGEIVTQASLNSKHSGSAEADASATPGLSGFPLIERLMNPPKVGRGLAVHAQTDGRVEAVKEASQGGQYITISGQEHYVPVGFAPQVKVGDRIEAGDTLSNGIPDPSQIINHKGIGEGRRYFVDSMRRGLDEAGFPVARRNIELLARGLVDRVNIDEEFGGFMPGSLASYSRVEKLYKPREDSENVDVQAAEGRYLEEPVLHYSIGTRLTPNTVKQLQAAKIRQIRTHKKPPPFSPVSVRSADLLQSDPDFMTQFLGSHLQKNLTTAIQLGGESDEDSTSFVPVRASAINLGRTEMTRSY